jgi:SAM-dependent methyltransferase
MKSTSEAAARDGMLHIDTRRIRRHGPGGIVGVCWRQWWTERALRRRGIRFRSRDREDCARAYAAMSAAEFDAINGRQEWANWRTIPRALTGQIPDRPLGVIDLGCGTGGSTRVLACCCPLGTQIIAYELTAPLIEIARRRRYFHHTGAPVEVKFVCQGVTEALRDGTGNVLAERSIDLVNASGVVGHHLDRETVQPLIDEVRRIILPEGLVLLDAGPTLGAKELQALMGRTGFGTLGRYYSCVFDVNGQLAFKAHRPTETPLAGRSNHESG